METTEQQLREVADLLFGDGADGLIRKMNPDSADIASKKKRERTQARIGLATNVVGIGAGAAATPAPFKAVGEKRREYKGMPPKHVPKHKGGKLTGFKRVAGGKKTALALAGAGAGLQVANLGGDFVANRVLSRSAKKDIHKREKPHIPNKADITIAATNKGVETIKTHKGSLKQIKGKMVHKAWDPKKITDAFQAGERAFKAGQGATDVAENIHQTSGSARRTAHHVENIARRADKATAPAAVVGGTAALGGAAGGGYALGRRKKKRGRLIKKSAGPSSAEYDVRWEGEFAKVNTDKQQVFGWASIVELNGEPVVDLQGDYISIDEVEKSAYEYVHKSRKGGDMHLRDGNQPVIASDMIESFVVTPEKRQALGLPDDTPSGWWVGFQVNDPALWSKVKSGQRTGFSIHGRGVRTPA
jgi:Putative phage serine protease XkdF